MRSALEVLGAGLQAAGAILVAVFVVGVLAGVVLVLSLPVLGPWARARASRQRAAPAARASAVKIGLEANPISARFH